MVGEQARAQGKRKRSILEERLCGERGSGVVWKKVCSSWGGSKHEKWLRKESQKVRKEEGGSVASGLEESSGEVMKLRSPHIKVRGGLGKADWIAVRIAVRRAKSLSDGK